MKKIFALLVMLSMLLSLVPVAMAEDTAPDVSKFEFPKPETPNYLMLEAADRTEAEGNDALYVVSNVDMSVLELSAEYYSDSDAFYEKYGLYSFNICMQFDTSLNGTDNWNYTPEWDTVYYAPGSTYEASGIFWIGSSKMKKENIFDLYFTDGGNRYTGLADAIITGDASDGFENYYFDYENHSLYIRTRYYMEWETYDGENIGDMQTMVSEWSDAAIFGKNSTAVVPTKPSGYEAPVISDLKYVPRAENSNQGYLTYTQFTPDQVWDAGVYYEMTADGYFDGLETEISVNGSDWQPYNTADAWSDWCLWNGERTAYYEEPKLEENSRIKLRIRFTGSEGVSPWSNILTIVGGDYVDSTEIFDDMDPDQWYTEAVNYVVTYGIMNGNADMSFNPNGKLTRAQFVQILANLSGVDTSDTNVETVFDDVNPGDWYAPAVKWASENGIVMGLTPTEFGPNENVERQQMCTMLYRYANAKGVILDTEKAEKINFRDAALILDYARDAVDTCQLSGLITGTPEGNFNPRGSATRAEIATMMMRFHSMYFAG